MNRGITLSQLAAKVEQAQAEQQDLLVPTNRMQMEVVGEGDAVLNVVGHKYVEPTQTAHKQIAAHLSIPGGYYNRMLEEKPELLARNVNDWMKDTKATRMLRTQGTDLRAYLSDRYKRIDHPVVLRESLEALQQSETKPVVLSSYVDQYGERLDLKVLFPEIQGEVKDGDVLHPGVAISNSETGGSTFSIQGFLYRTYCLNGMIFGTQLLESGMRRRHSGARLAMGENFSIYAEDTLKAEAEYLAKQSRDIVRTFASQEALDTMLDMARAAAASEKVKDPESAIEVLSKDYGLSETERTAALINLIDDRDYSQWGVANAVTKVANDLESYSRSTELELMGSQIMTMGLNQWNKVRVAA